MDYVTRQFINLTKHFRKDLRKALSGLSGALQEQTKAIDEASEGYRKQRQEPQPVSAEIRLPPEVERQRQAEHKRSHAIQVIIAFATVGTFVAAAFYGAVAAVQWWDFQKSIGISQIIARQTRIQAASSLQGSIAAKDNADLARIAFHAEQRAWVMPNVNFEGRIHIAVDAALELPISITNVGKTPARDVDVTVVVDIFRMDEVLPVGDYSAGRAKTRYHYNLLFPNSTRNELPHSLLNKYPSLGARMTADTTRLWFERKAYAAIFGQVTYFDILGHQHWVHFCGSAENSGPLVSLPLGKRDSRLQCTQYNDVDSDLE